MGFKNMFLSTNLNGDNLQELYAKRCYDLVLGATVRCDSKLE